MLPLRSSFARRAALLWIAAFGLAGICAAGGDVVRRDPKPSEPPAAMAELAIPSSGARLNGLLYLAAGAGRHPIAIFLHGFPGNEKNLDLAQAVRRAGFDVLYVDYRGNWGSGGTFSFAHGLEDVGAVLAWVRSPENAVKFHFDARRIALVGHSFGGWLALMTAGHEPAEVCVAALAAWNIGWDGKRFGAHEDERAAALADFQSSTDPAGGPIRAGADDLLAEMTTHAAEYDYLAQAAVLAPHPMLLVAASRDTPDEDIPMHAELGRAIKAAGGTSVRNLTFDDDHSFSSHRVALAERLVDWLRTDCARFGGKRGR